jgi:hypothetical protein
MMFVRIKDGLVHKVKQYETADHYGLTVCRASFTQDKVHSRLNEETSPAKTSKPPVTCLQCIAKDGV